MIRNKHIRSPYPRDNNFSRSSRPSRQSMCRHGKFRLGPGPPKRAVFQPDGLYTYILRPADVNTPVVAHEDRIGRLDAQLLQADAKRDRGPGLAGNPRSPRHHGGLEIPLELGKSAHPVLSVILLPLGVGDETQQISFLQPAQDFRDFGKEHRLRFDPLPVQFLPCFEPFPPPGSFRTCDRPPPTSPFLKNRSGRGIPFAPAGTPSRTLPRTPAPGRP